MNLDEVLQEQLAKLEEAHLRRRLLLPGENGPLINFASNDYLGLSRHPVLLEAARRATDDGSGAGASRLLAENSAAILDLEITLAAWKQKAAALVFSSGYAAALGTIPALVGRGDTVILDKLVHASLIDAARLSGATIRVFPHNHLGKLASLLQKLEIEPGRRLVVTESIFSMDGDTAPLREIVELKNRHGAWLMVDEAHATGLYGSDGSGLLSELGLGPQVEVIMATQSKALGSVGGMIAGSQALIDWLLNRARSFVFSTGLPPATTAASRAAVNLLRSPEGTRLRGCLRENIAHFRSGLPKAWLARAPSGSAIQPLHCGEASEALRLASILREAGFFVPAIRHPTVPRQAARLRVTLSATHTVAQIDALLQVLGKLA